MNENSIWYTIGAFLLGILGAVLGIRKFRNSGRASEGNRDVERGISGVEESKSGLKDTVDEGRGRNEESKRTVEKIRYESGRISRSTEDAREANKSAKESNRTAGDLIRESKQTVDRAGDTIESAEKRLARINELAKKLRDNGSD